MDISSLIAERSKTHGNYSETSNLSIQLAIASAPSKTTEPHAVRYGREMICGKLARVACGNALLPEHWDDIAGYAYLIAGWIRSQQSTAPDGFPVHQNGEAP